MSHLAQTFGWSGAILIVAGFGSPGARRMTVLVTGGFVLMSVHLALLGVWTGTAAYLLAAAGYLVAHWRGTDWKQAAFFSSATLVMAVLTWEGWVQSGLFAAGNSMAFVILATLTGLRMRLAMAVVTVLFLAAFVLIGSLPGVVLETFVLCSSMLAVWRLQRSAEQEVSLARQGCAPAVLEP